MLFYEMAIVNCSGNPHSNSYFYCFRIGLEFEHVGFCGWSCFLILLTQLYPDAFAKQELLSHAVFCRLKNLHGCPWKGPLSELEVC